MEEKLPDRIFEQSNTTLRPVSDGAEKWLYRPIQCLDHGFVYLVDYTGNDIAITEAAGVSYGQGTKKVSTAEGLIRYLRRHVHTSPSEMVEVKFHCKMPIFVARQWIRHRTASVNEYSGRYSVMADEFYIPGPGVIKKQALDNKQGRSGDLDVEAQREAEDIFRSAAELPYSQYQRLIELGVARELARIVLPVSNYTQWYWKMDLHNLMHFLRLRLDPHAQYEIRVFGDAIARIIKDAFPISYKAFEDYQLYAVNFSRLELEILSQNQWPANSDKVASILEDITNKRERGEFLEKLNKLNFII